MNILFIGYWSMLDSLSEATIRPHLRVLSSMDNIKAITYISIEREIRNVNCNWDIAKVKHIPYYSLRKPLFLNKIMDLTFLPKYLINLCTELQIDRVICRASPAGSIGYLIWKKTKIPFYVESFEPHADYMFESGVWYKWDLRYLIQKYFEKKQKQNAAALIPVSNNYKEYLLDTEKVTPPVYVLPCTVDLQRFKFCKDDRYRVRKKLNINDADVVGIYVGKFGDIYYDEESFKVFSQFAESWKDFFLILLCPQDSEFIRKRLLLSGYPSNRFWLGKVLHDEIPQYLSASDFGFCPVKSSKSRKFCSPIKNGEYWANGLPIFISKDIGDDSALILKKNGGAIIDFSKGINRKCFIDLREIANDANLDRQSNGNTRLATVNRNPEVISKLYSIFFK